MTDERTDGGSATVGQQPQLGADGQRLTECARLGRQPAGDHEAGDQYPTAQGAEEAGTGRQSEPGDGRELVGAGGTDHDGRLGRGEIDVAAVPAR